jgi:hypothetical protein
LERHRLVEVAQARDDSLEVVTALARHAHRISLDLRLDLGKLVADQFRDALGDLVVQATAKPDPLANLVSAGLLGLAPFKDLEREATPDRLGLDQILDGSSAMLVIRQQRQLRLRLGQLDGDALEIEPRADLATYLVEGVPQLLLIEVAHDVE